MSDSVSLESNVKYLLIGGRHVPSHSGQTFTTYNPTSGQPLAEVARAGVEDVNDAFLAARSAFETWRFSKPYQRQELLLKLADLIEEHFYDLAYLDTKNMGAPISSMQAKRHRVIGLLRYYAGLATNLHGQTIPNSQNGNIFSYTLKEPIGVVGAINPWNSPLIQAVWKIAPALAAGCAVVLKPAEQAPLSSLRIGELCLEAGIPAGLVNVVPGFGDAGAALALHPGVDKVAFTGSTEVGRKIVEASADNIKRVSLELGGKSPNIVFDDANLDIAVPGAAMAAFANTGQICSAGTRLFVQRKIADEFIEKLSNFARTVKVGDPTDIETQLGPLASKGQFDRVTSYIEQGSAEGAIAVSGCEKKHPDQLAKGYFVSPTVFSGVSDNMRIAREEIFGPVLSVLVFDTIDEVIRRANDTPYGLGAGVWTRDIDNAMAVTQGVQSGSVWVNCYQIMDPAIPFGGYKQSGYGRESGVEHMEMFLNTKSVWIKSGIPARG